MLRTPPQQEDPALCVGQLAVTLFSDALKICRTHGIDAQHMLDAAYLLDDEDAGVMEGIAALEAA